MGPARLLLPLLLAVLPAAAEEPFVSRWAPPSNFFSCDLPGPEWSGFEEEEVSGPVARILGPDSPGGSYRAGISVRWVEKGQPGWRPYKEAIEALRRSDKEAGRHAGGARPLRIAGILSRIFEVTERRRLPPDQLPAAEEELHHYVALVPLGDSYYVIKLSSTRENYLDYRDAFVRFLRSFRPLGGR